MATVSPVPISSLQLDTPSKCEVTSLLPHNILCNLCYLPSSREGSFSTNCHCYKVLSPLLQVEVTITTQKELDELFQQVDSETLPIELNIILPYEAHALDSALLKALGKALLTKNITSLHLYVRYIYNEHKDDDIVWRGVIKDFALAIANNSTLKRLDLSGWHLTFIKDLVSILQTSNSLLSLNLQDVAVGGHEDEAEGIQASLNDYVALQSLNLSGNCIKKFDLVPLFRKNSTLTSLDLSDNLISEKGILEIAQGLEFSSSLRSLCLAKNKLSPSNISGLGHSSAAALARAVERDLCLEQLNLSNNDLDASGITRIAIALKTNTKFKSLDLSHNPQIGDKGAVALGQTLRTTGSIITLNLSNIGMGDEGTLAIAQALESNTTLQVLNLAGNSGSGGFSGKQDTNDVITYTKTSGICTLGAIAIAKGLEKNSALQLLDLGGCGINSEGMLAIATALKNNRSLKSLIAKSNGVNNAVATMLASPLEANSPLRSLNLQGCWIGDDGVISIARALCTNSQLIVLDLRSNPFSMVGVRAVAEVLKKNVTLRSLYLGGKFEEDAVKAVVTALANHSRLSEQLQNFVISWSTVYSSWYETRWDSEITCSEGIWSYVINGSTIASANSFFAFWNQIKNSTILPHELKWLCDISISEASTVIIARIGKKILSPSSPPKPPEPRGRERSSSNIPLCSLV